NPGGGNGAQICAAQTPPGPLAILISALDSRQNGANKGFHSTLTSSSPQPRHGKPGALRRANRTCARPDTPRASPAQAKRRPVAGRAGFSSRNTAWRDRKEI